MLRMGRGMAVSCTAAKADGVDRTVCWMLDEARFGLEE